MFSPWTMMPGIVFDTRSVMLAVTGVFFGAIPTIIAMLIAAIVRFFMGGDGVWMGIAVIISSGTIGILWAKIKSKRNLLQKPAGFLLLGLVVHLVMMGTSVFLPAERIIPTLQTISLAVFLIYTPGTMLLGMLFEAQKRNFLNRSEKERLLKNEQELSHTLKQHQNELQDQLENFQQLNEEYMAQNEELLQAKDKAEESDRLKSAFLANLSHEIRTPMNSILGFSDLLSINNLEKEKRDNYITIIQNSGDYLLTIINDIIEMSQIDASQVNVKESAVDLNNFFDGIYESFVVSVPADKKLKVEIEKDENAGQLIILTDEIKLSQVLNNLLNNALKFTENGVIKMGFSVDKAKEEVSYYVEDTGIGIAPNKQEVIFERFRQVQSNEFKYKKGSGLGLSISKAYVEMMGGTIAVESELGKGSVFTVTLPLKTIEQKTQNFKSAPVNLEPSEKTVLVAEDEELNWFFLEQVLLKYNIKCLRAENGKEAVELCRMKNDIDLVLMDIKMPEMNGYEAARFIRQHRPNMKLIAQTAYALPNDIVKLKDSFDDYITKPIDRNLLIQKISEVRVAGK
jgi:signal transduction histidine kinase/CheY-like chemotaxis protein